MRKVSVKERRGSWKCRCSDDAAGATRCVAASGLEDAARGVPGLAADE